MSALRLAAPDTSARAATDPWKWAPANGLHPRFAHLVGLDWRYLRRPRLESLQRLTTALGLPPETAAELATRFPAAIAKEPPR